MPASRGKNGERKELKVISKSTPCIQTLKTLRDERGDKQVFHIKGKI
jgi:hypothetical protein